MIYTKNIGNKLKLQGYDLTEKHVCKLEFWSNGTTTYIINHRLRTVVVRDMRVLPCVGHDRITEIE